MEYISECNLCNCKDLEFFDPISNICRCSSCGYVFDNPRPDKKDLIAYYSKTTKYDSWLRKEKARDSLWKRRLQKMKKIRDGGSLLDIGAGIGQFLFHARTQYDVVMGTEVSISAISIAKERYGIDLIAGEVETLEIGRQFDCITIFHVLEHVYNPRAVIEKCRFLLNDHGCMVIAVPNELLSLESRVKFLLKKLGFKRFRNVSPLGLSKITLDGSLTEIHVSHFTPDVLKNMLEGSGFIVVENTLDPYFAASGLSLVFHYLYYYLHVLLFYATGRNWYDTIWMVARKNSMESLCLKA
ncbi:MAG TPA: class I SAM-dependent methyltransferase [Syntrophorhabdus sp.]|jgi:ubiquinone/menaquinone biosynthesis C-methylase UbiE|nr:class I SAM-dependent methyltransferase [Syntrophorhabdus sp.]